MFEPLDVIEKQSEVIRIQSDVINGLLNDLMQHITVEEADKLPEVTQINLAAQIRSEINC